MSEKIIERIRKLLAKANDSAITEEESLMFAAKARELMIEYEISAESVGDDQSGDYVMEVVPVENFGVWKGMVRQAAAKMYFCEMLLECDDPKNATTILLFGAKRHLEAARSFGQYLEAAIMRKGAAYPNRSEVFFESFRNQAAHVLSVRIAELIKKEKAPSVPGSNLPVPVAMEDQLMKALKDKMGGGDTEFVKAQAKVEDPLGLVLGAQAGAEIALNQQVGGGGQKTGLLGSE